MDTFSILGSGCVRVLAAVHDVLGGACVLFVIGRAKVCLLRLFYGDPRPFDLSRPPCLFRDLGAQDQWAGCWRDVSLSTWSWWFQRGPRSTT